MSVAAAIAWRSLSPAARRVRIILDGVDGVVAVAQCVAQTYSSRRSATWSTVPAHHAAIYGGDECLQSR
jgi:hypothetical protein